MLNIILVHNLLEFFNALVIVVDLVLFFKLSIEFSEHLLLFMLFFIYDVLELHFPVKIDTLCLWFKIIKNLVYVFVYNS